MKNHKLILVAAAVVLMATFAGCKKDDSGKDNSGNSTTSTSVPDPAGTITANISKTTSIPISYAN